MFGPSTLPRDDERPKVKVLKFENSVKRSCFFQGKVILIVSFWEVHISMASSCLWFDDSECSQGIASFSEVSKRTALAVRKSRSRPSFVQHWGADSSTMGN